MFRGLVKYYFKLLKNSCMTVSLSIKTARCFTAYGTGVLFV